MLAAEWKLGMCRMVCICRKRHIKPNPFFQFPNLIVLCSVTIFGPTGEI
jgi:hypothetical protein